MQHDKLINYVEDHCCDKDFADVLQNPVNTNSAEQQQY
jgi:hypothetical protein